MPIGTTSSWFPSVGADRREPGGRRADGHERGLEGRADSRECDPDRRDRAAGCSAGARVLEAAHSGTGVARTYAAVRRAVKPLDGDRPLTADIERTATGIRAGEFDPEAA